MSLHKAGFRL